MDCKGSRRKADREKDAGNHEEAGRLYPESPFACCEEGFEIDTDQDEAPAVGTAGDATRFIEKVVQERRA